jgi:hypothetical protein
MMLLVPLAVFTPVASAGRPGRGRCHSPAPRRPGRGPSEAEGPGLRQCQRVLAISKFAGQARPGISESLA